MRARSLGAPLVVALAAAIGSCTQVSTSPTLVVALEFDSLPYPAIVTGDSLRDSLGRATPLHALAFNTATALVAGAPVRYIALDTGLTIDASGMVTAQLRNGPVRIVASISDLQTSARTILVTRRPDTAFAVGATDTTILFSIPDSAARNVTGLLGVRLATGDSSGGITRTQGWLVSYQATFHGATLALADTTRASLWDEAGKVSSLDTTTADGLAGRRLRIRSTLLSAQLDSFVVLATVRYRGAQVRGSPIRFVVHVKPK
jgi:hypothetical protein